MPNKRQEKAAKPTAADKRLARKIVSIVENVHSQPYSSLRNSETLDQIEAIARTFLSAARASERRKRKGKR